MIPIWEVKQELLSSGWRAEYRGGHDYQSVVVRREDRQGISYEGSVPLAEEKVWRAAWEAHRKALCEQNRHLVYKRDERSSGCACGNTWSIPGQQSDALLAALERKQEVAP